MEPIECTHCGTKTKIEDLLIECSHCGKESKVKDLIMSPDDEPFCSDCAEQLDDEAYQRQKEEGVDSE
jgi:hypothetical protein